MEANNRPVYEIGSTALHYNKIEELLKSHAFLKLSDLAIGKIQECRNYLDKKAENPDTPIYGVTTGFGSL